MTKTVKLKVLTRTERADFERLEGIVDHGKQTFLEVGQALLEINTRKLYKATHRAWDRYCWDRHKIHKSQAYRLMEAVRIVANIAKLSPIGDSFPDHESQVRPFGKLRTSEEQARQWEKLVEDGDGLPTAEEAEEAVEEFLAGLDDDERERLLKEERRAKATVKATAKPEVRVRQLTTCLGFLERALRKLSRVEDTDEEQQLAAELIDLVRERL